MNAVYGLYPDGNAAQEAVNRLRLAGVEENDITICSLQQDSRSIAGLVVRPECLGGMILVGVERCAVRSPLQSLPRPFAHRAGRL